MPISRMIGDCPEHTPQSGEEDWEELCHGLRDDPPSMFGDRTPGANTAGFTFEGVVQFFWIDIPSISEIPDSRLRRHSCVALRFTSVGLLDFVLLDNYKNDLVFTPLWVINDTYSQLPEIDLFDESSCPILPPDLTSSASHQVTTTGCHLRVMALKGSYDAGLSSVSCELQEPDMTCVSARKVYYDSVPILSCSTVPINEADPTLCGEATEMILEFGSTGHLVKVYWGGNVRCDDNPCVWDINDPPEGTAGVTIPMIQFVNDTFNNNFRIWQVHFDSTGRYVKACEYALLCGCEIEPPSSVSSTMGCVCHALACVITGNCTVPYRPHYCPSTLAFPCAEAIEPGCESSSGALEGKFCVYSLSPIGGGSPCCDPATYQNQFVSDIRSEGVVSAEACRYAGNHQGCTA